MNMKRVKELGFTLNELVGLVWIGFIVLGGIGWIMNIVKLCHYTTMDVHTIVRIIGVFTLIGGAIMGYMSF